MSATTSTRSVAMINLVMTGADNTGGVWQDQVQLIPLGMYSDPEGFVARIKENLPLVNNLRVLFNEHSFNPDGSLHPQMEAFLTAAVAQGFDLTICYAEGDAQNIGRGEGRWPLLSNAEAYAALQDNLGDVSGAWDAMMTWMDGHADVAAGVYGWELMNESAAYRNSVRANGAGDGLTAADFVKLYADHAIALSNQISARAEGHVLVGGWGYNGDFLTLQNTRIEGVSALDYLRAGVGDNLVWSAHLYPGWMDTDAATTPAELLARLEQVYAPVAQDAVLITEINAHGQIDNPAQAQGYDDFFAASYEWFAAHGIGLGWYPGLQSGASHLLFLESNGTETYRHQHSLAHALNAFSMGQTPVEGAGNQVVTASLVTARLRNEPYEIALGEAEFDAQTKAGFGFGYAGNDTVNGTNASNDFLYGGTGNDVVSGLNGDDFLFGQHGNDRLLGGGAIDHLFGGWGADTLDGGAGNDVMVGGRDNDTYLVTETRDIVIEQLAEGRDLIQTTLSSYALGANLENLTYLGAARFTGTGTAAANQITGGSGADVLYGLAGADTLSGGAGADLLIGGQGADRLYGGTGVDTASYASATRAVWADLVQITTQAAAGDAAGDSFSSIERLIGSAYSDRLSGNSGANTLWGGRGHDVLTGRAGADTLFGQDGNDRLYGGTGADNLQGQTGNDRLYGGDGNDQLRGQAGNDQLFGGSGADVLRGQSGNDQLTGGAGADRFVFAKDDDADRVRDFHDNVDTLVFSGFTGVNRAQDALDHARQAGAHVIFDFGHGDTLWVTNTTLAALGNDITVL